MSLNDVKEVKICNSSDLILKKILYARTQKTSSEYTNYDDTHIKEYRYTLKKSYRKINEKEKMVQHLVSISVSVWS